MAEQLINGVRLRDLVDDVVVTEEQICELDLSKLPRKVQLRLHRAEGLAVIEHVGKNLVLRLYSDAKYGSKLDHRLTQAVYEMSEVAMREAAGLLDFERMQNPLYGSCSNPVTMTVPEKSTGLQAISLLNAAAQKLVAKVNELFRMTATGVRLVFPADSDID